MLPHNKIIKTTVKEFLEPKNLFQVGSSRSWLDDNGYFFVIVDFSSNSYSKGARLNAGVSFLWESTESLNESLSYNYGCQVNAGYVEYKNDDEVFKAGIEKLAKRALEKVDEYRNFSNMEYAKSCLQKQVDNLPEHRRFWELYHLAMLCFLKGDFEEGKEVFEHYLQRLKDSFYSGDYYIEWHEQFYNYCIENIQCHLTSQKAAQQMVVDMINRRRKNFCEKFSYKKMNKEPYSI